MGLWSGVGVGRGDLRVAAELAGVAAGEEGLAFEGTAAVEEGPGEGVCGVLAVLWLGGIRWVGWNGVDLG